MRTLLTLLSVLALLAAPVAASTLVAEEREPPAPASPAPAAAPTAAPAPAPSALAATVPLAPRPPTVPGDAFPAPLGLDEPLRRAAADRRATALAAARREGAHVLVDKRRGLPARYAPRDLVVPRVAFLAGVTEEGRRLRRRPARALERLFADARRDGVRLAGVSGFRSFASQRALFAGYASERGAASAAHVSARAGHSEHQTGLAIDIAGADGRCAASACFAGTRAARWLARHAADHGFVVRYPRGKEHVTGYDHEPWHLRYVGPALAAEATATGRTLDELLPPR